MSLSRRRATAFLLLGLLSLASRLRGEENVAPPAWLTVPPTPTLPETTRSGHVTVNGIGIRHAQFGDGPRVLLLHGGHANANYWGPSFARLRRMSRSP